MARSRTPHLKLVEANIRRARELAKHYEIDQADPSELLSKQPDDFDRLLSQMK